MKNFGRASILYLINIFLAILFILIIFLFSDLLLGGVHSLVALICGVVSLAISTVFIPFISAKNKDVNQTEQTNMAVFVLLAYTFISVIINLVFGLALYDMFAMKALSRLASVLIVLNVFNAGLMIIIEIVIHRYKKDLAIKTEKSKNFTRPRK